MKMQSIVPVEGGVAALTRRIAVPVTALLLIGLVVILFVMWSAARDRDDVAATASLRTARSALNVLQEHLGRTISDYAIWDESMQHLHVAFDPAWASQNVGRYIAEDYHINTVLVISPATRSSLRSKEMRRRRPRLCSGTAIRRSSVSSRRRARQPPMSRA